MKYEAKNKLKWWRHHLMIDTQKEFAEVIQCTPQQVNVWEKQESQPNVSTAYSIANLLSNYTGTKIYIEDIFEWIPK